MVQDERNQDRCRHMTRNWRKRVLLPSIAALAALPFRSAFAQSENWKTYKDAESPVNLGIIEGKTSVKAETDKGRHGEDFFSEVHPKSHPAYRSIYVSADLANEGFRVYRPNDVPLLSIFLYETPEGLADAAAPPKGPNFDASLLGRRTKCDWRDGSFNGTPALTGVKGNFDVFILLTPGAYPYVMRQREDSGWRDSRFIIRRNHLLDETTRRFRWRKPIRDAGARGWRRRVLKALGCGEGG